ncbi:hypothetical protein [Robertmurraya kyonggiensis]|nr:hypothetical protein [Robertmurraya kyonggiensis]
MLWTFYAWDYALYETEWSALGPFHNNNPYENSKKDLQENILGSQ